MILFRPVGLRELELIAEADFAAFPARLPHQPYFYPVLTEDYAHQIARDWNTKDAASGYVGFVTSFEVEGAFASRYTPRVVGASNHRELWVPASELDEFNAHIVGTIRVIHAYTGDKYRGALDPGTWLPAGLSGATKAATVVYRLEQDAKYIEGVQKATLTTEEFGIADTHGLFGSEAWWGQIRSGALPVRTLRGTITRVYMGSMGDWPEFEVCDSAGELSQWTREANNATLAKVYEPNCGVEIDYVVQRHRPKSFDEGAETKIVLEIRVARSL